MSNFYTLFQIGWQSFFQQQLTLEEWESLVIARVVSQQRSVLQVLTEQGKQSLDLTPNMPVMTVGDWLLLEHDANGSVKFIRLLERLSLFSRKAAGSKVATQLIAANIDTVFIVCSLNQDFNLNRIERYLALANEAGVEPLVVLSKADCCENPEHYLLQLQSLDPMLMVFTVNGLDPSSVNQLQPWCCEGKTVALLGSSGVGKSTLINTLSGDLAQQTQAVRSDDDKGRHTTTGRSLHMLSSGGLLLDTPGMRELQLSHCEQGVNETFSEISELASRCKFADCQHENEPGCAVRAAIDKGELQERRLSSYLKLMREQAYNTATLAEKRAKERNLSRLYRSVQSEKQHLKKE